MPTNFQHISHVGWDPNHGFDLENVDPNLKKFFQKAGVDEKALQDKDTRDFIYDFIDKHGGVEAALREVIHEMALPSICVWQVLTPYVLAVYRSLMGLNFKKKVIAANR